MKKIFSFLMLSLVAMSMSAAIDWSAIAWVGASGDKFKVGAEDAANLPDVVNVQQPGFAAEPGIYMTFPAAGITCTHECAVQGAGIVLYTSQFTAQETEVTVNYAGGSKTFVVFFADGTAGAPEGPVASEYCAALFSTGNTACRMTWETLANGDIQVTLLEPDRTVAAATHFRGNGIKIAEMTVNGEPASNYFTTGTNLNTNVQTFALIDPANKPAEGAAIVVASAVVEYAVVADGNAWPTFGFSYTYGGVCSELDAPANVAVTDAGVVTFDAVEGAESYVVYVYDGEREVYNGAITSGAQIDYEVYVAKTLTVKVVAKIGVMESDFSAPATWNAAAAPMAASIWCETPGVVTAANECSHAAFTINTLADGNVTIEIVATEGTEDGAKFRGNKGMNGTFKLNGSAADFATYFTAALSVDKKVVTLSLVDPANKPEMGSIIDYTGQIECASSLHQNDWSNYNILGYVYGSSCPTDVAATGVALNKTTATIYVGDAPLQLNAIFTPSNAANKNVTWASSNTAVATVADGAVTPVAAGEATITVTTEDGGFTATCVVTVAGAIVAPAAPTYPESQVKAIYSATYNANCGFGEWGSGTQYSQMECGKKYVGGTYFGLIDFALNCAAMEKFHMDVFPLQDMTIRVVPIWGGAEQGITTVNLVANQWNAVDIEMSQWTGITDWTNVYQVKLDQFAAGSVFYLNNVYFYRETPSSDTEAPVMTSASLVSTSFTSAVIAVAATDNELVAQYLVKNGDAEVGMYAAADGKITVKNLAMGTAYNLSVYAVDAADNVSANKVDVALTTLAAPTVLAAPTAAAEDVIALYSDAYTTVNYTIGGWGQATHEENLELAAGEHVLYMTNCNYQGWEFATQDLSEMTHLHFDVYVAEAGTIQFTPIWGGEAVHTFNLVAGWNAIDAELLATWPAINLANVYQVKFAEMPKICFIDNVYFYKQAAAPATGMTYELNGGTLPAAEAPATNEDLWAEFMVAYNAYTGEGRAEQTMANAAVFCQAGTVAFLTADDSPWKWLGDYMMEATVGSPKALNASSTAVTWRFGVKGFFTCAAENNSYTGNADFSAAGQPSAWGPAYAAANAVVLPETITEDYVLPTPVKEGYTFGGWFWTEDFTGEAVTTLTAGDEGTLYAKWNAEHPTSLENVENAQVVKFMENGQLFIMKNGVIYNAMGQIVK